MTKTNEEKTGFTGRDKSQGNLRDGPTATPEGFKRERKGPLDIGTEELRCRLVKSRTPFNCSIRWRNL